MPLFERNSSIRVDRVAEPDENVWISLFDGPPNVRRVHFLVPVAAPESNSGRRCALRERDEHGVVHFVSSVFDRVAIQKRPRRDGTREREKEKIPKTVTKEDKKEIAQRRTRRGGISSLFMTRAPARRTEQEEDQEEEESSKKKKSPPSVVLLLRRVVVMMMMLPFYLFCLWVRFSLKFSFFFLPALHPKPKYLA